MHAHNNKLDYALAQVYALAKSLGALFLWVHKQNFLLVQYHSSFESVSAVKQLHT